MFWTSFWRRPVIAARTIAGALSIISILFASSEVDDKMRFWLSEFWMSLLVDWLREKMRFASTYLSNSVFFSCEHGARVMSVVMSLHPGRHQSSHQLSPCHHQLSLTTRQVVTRLLLWSSFGRHQSSPGCDHGCHFVVSHQSSPIIFWAGNEKVECLADEGSMLWL
jgi:hypothetical protein